MHSRLPGKVLRVTTWLDKHSSARLPLYCGLDAGAGVLPGALCFHIVVQASSPAVCGAGQRPAPQELTQLSLRAMRKITVTLPTWIGKEEAQEEVLRDLRARALLKREFTVAK